MRGGEGNQEAMGLVGEEIKTGLDGSQGVEGEEKVGQECCREAFKECETRNPPQSFAGPGGGGN